MKRLNKKNISKVSELLQKAVRTWDNERDLLYINWILRMTALIAVVLYFVYARAGFVAPQMVWIKLSLLAFFAYNVVSGFFGFMHREWFTRLPVKMVQFFLEIVIYSLFYYLSGDFRTDLYLLYFLPLFFAARFLTFFYSLLITAWGGLCLYASILWMTAPAGSALDSLWLAPSAGAIFWPRFVILVAVCTTYAFRRRTSLTSELVDPDAKIKDILQSLEDGIFVVDRNQGLVYVNDALQTRHGKYQPGQPWTEYFRLNLPKGAVLEAGRATFIDRDGAEYRVDLDMIPLVDESSRLESTLVIARDIDRPARLEKDLRAQIQIKGSQVESLTSQRILWQRTYAELGRHLQGIQDPQKILYAAVADVCSSLKAETAGIFFLEADGSLSRRAVHGVNPNRISDENYPHGVGITSNVLPQPGSRYGQPVRNNNVDQDEHVVAEFLQAYRSLLPSGQVKHLLAVPLNGQESTFGVLRVVNKLRQDGSLSPEGFNADDEDFLVTIASFVAIAVENTRLVFLEKKRREYSEALLEISRKINSHLANRKLFQEILDELARVLEFTSITIQILQKEELEIIACRGFDRPKELMHRRFPVNDPKYPNHRVCMEGKSLRLPDVSQEYPHFASEARHYQSEHIRSWMGIPLLVRDKVIGMVSIDHEQPAFYTAEMEQLAIDFSHQVATAIENARLFTENKAQLDYLKKFAQVSQTIASSVVLKNEMDKIVTMARLLSRSKKTSVVLYNNGIFDRSFGDLHLGKPLHRILREGGVAYQVVEQNRRVIYNHIQPGDARHNESIQREGVKSYATLPITAAGKVLGVLVLSSDKPNHYRTAALRLMETLCNQAAVAIDNALVVEQLTDQADMLKRFVEASNGLIGHTTFENLIRFCVDTSVEIFGVEDCSLFMTYPEKNTIELVCSKVIPRTIWKRREFHLDEPGLTAFVAKTGKILNLRKDEYQNQPAWGGRSESPFRDHFPFLPSKESNSLLMGPLKDSDGRIVGVLKLENKVGAARLQKFSPFEEALHTTLASHIGTAIERARLFEKLDSRAQEEARAALTNELHELSTFIHSLLILRLEVIRNRLDRDPKYDVRGELESLSRSTKSVHSRLRLVMAGLASEETLMVQGLIPALEDLANLMDIRVEFHEKGTLILPGKVENALYRLAGEALFNSKLHGGESVKAMINFEHDAGRYSLEVRDDGKGFDVDTARTNQSSIGLNSMGYYAHTIGAEYDINSVPGYGTTVKVHGKIQAKGTQA